MTHRMQPEIPADRADPPVVLSAMMEQEMLWIDARISHLLGELRDECAAAGLPRQQANEVMARAERRLRTVREVTETRLLRTVLSRRESDG